MRAQIAVVSLLATAILAPLSAHQGGGPAPIVVHTQTGKHIEIDLSIVNNCKAQQTVDLFLDGLGLITDTPLFVSVGAGERRIVRLSGTAPSSLTTAGSDQTGTIVFAFGGAPSCAPKVTEQPMVVRASLPGVGLPQDRINPAAPLPPVAEANFTMYDDNGLYFRTAPSDVMQGQILAAAMDEPNAVMSDPAWVDEADGDPQGQLEGATTDGAPINVPGNATAPGVSGANLQLLHAIAFKANTRWWQTPAPTRPLTVYLTSLGRSTGDAFTLTALNHGRDPVSLNVDDLVLEPVRGVAAARAAREIANHRGGRLTRILTAYCLEFLKAPPAAGTVFRVADRRLRDKFSRFGHIMAATRRMQRYGLLPPEGGDARAYFHSIRQWAVWTQEQAFDERRFGDAFVQHTRKNAEQAGRQWTDAFETAARSLVPWRWKAVQFALQEAARFERARSTGGRGR